MPKREQLEQLLQADPDDVFVRYALAMACFSEGDHPAGIRGLDEVIERDPKYVPAYFQKGQQLAIHGETGEAKEVIERGIAVASDVGDAHAHGEMTAFLETL